LGGFLLAGSEVYQLSKTVSTGFNSPSTVNSKLQVTPNPIRNDFEVNFDSSERYNLLEIHDLTGKLIAKQEFENYDVRYYRNIVNRGWLWNAVNILTNEISDDDIVILYDLDDWFPHKNCLQEIYDTFKITDCWLYSGSYDRKDSEHSSYFVNHFYPDNVVKNKSFREYYPWSFTHPRCFKGFLWNYINFDDNMIRKGAISAHKGEKVVIPLNMKSGIILGTGKGNPNWHMSSPHGAGRIMSRGEAKRNLKLNDYQNCMEGIYNSTICQDTIDEAPAAYKPSKVIIDAIKDTVDIDKIIKPVYVIKSQKKE
jgi:hypothetical protein